MLKSATWEPTCQDSRHEGKFVCHNAVLQYIVSCLLFPGGAGLRRAKIYFLKGLGAHVFTCLKTFQQKACCFKLQFKLFMELQGEEYFQHLRNTKCDITQNNVSGDTVYHWRANKFQS
jgi:hypothetical protein